MHGAIIADIACLMRVLNAVAMRRKVNVGQLHGGSSNLELFQHLCNCMLSRWPCRLLLQRPVDCTYSGLLRALGCMWHDPPRPALLSLLRHLRGVRWPAADAALQQLATVTNPACSDPPWLSSNQPAQTPRYEQQGALLRPHMVEQQLACSADMV
jgi:hypothetical protein